MKHQLKTLGHATLLLLEDNQPLIATDPWLVGSTYWRSWWLEKYPTEEEFEQVKQVKQVYITHSHPDHFHYPTLRKIGKVSTLHPSFSHYELPEFLKSNGYPVKTLEPWQWYKLSEQVKIVSVPIPIDDSILILNTPNAYIVDLNDSVPRNKLLRLIKSRLLSEDKAIIVLKSYSPASIAVSIYREGVQTQMKTRKDYTKVAEKMAEALGASYFIPFASQAFFNRKDSKWANDFKVKYEDLKQFWSSESVELCQPFANVDLDTLTFTSDYSNINRHLDEDRLKKVYEREEEEENFVLPEDFEGKLQKYMSELYFLRTIFRRGIGWRLTSSGKECFYNTRTGKTEDKIPENFDVIINLPDKVLYESLENNVLTDLGITMFIKVETKVSNKLTYGLFLLMGLHDYGYFNNYKEFAKFVRFYTPYFIPRFLIIKQALSSKPTEQRIAEI